MKNLLYSVMFLALVGYAGNKINNTTGSEPVKAAVYSTNIEVHPQVSGYVDKVYVQEGDYVTSDQPLFKLKSTGCEETANAR